MSTPVTYCTECGFRSTLVEGKSPDRCPACKKFSVQVEGATIACMHCSTKMSITEEVCPSCKVVRNVKRRGRDERVIKVSDI